jgi:hypothetical protein
MRKFVQGVVEIRSLKFRGQRTEIRGRRAWSTDQGAGSSKRRAFRLSVLGYQVDKGEQNYRTSGRRTRLPAVISYPITSMSAGRERGGGAKSKERGAGSRDAGFRRGRPDSEDFHMPISAINPVVDRPGRKDTDFHASPDSISFMVI